MLLGDLCTYVIINITVYLMLLLLTVFRIKDKLLLLLILAFIFIFTPDTYIGSKYRLSVYLICNNRYRYRPWKTHIGRPLVNSVYIKAVFVYKVGYQSVITIPGSAHSRSQSCDS